MKKHKILFISDHPLSTSGVGTQARWLITSLLETGKYTFRCFGGAMKHEDLSVIRVNDDFIIKPTNGFGDRNLLRQVLASEKPDALFLFTDPRFFIWVWQMEDEIHQMCPIVYNHLWDNDPWPEFNRVLYDSCDYINCINYPTYEMCKTWYPNTTEYVPHALPADLYTPGTREESRSCRSNILGLNRADNFTLLYVSRNARRKMPSDIVDAWSIFMRRLQQEEGHSKATLLMHCDPNDQEGPNLHHVVKVLGVSDSVVFSPNRVNFDQMRQIYIASDAVINCSVNEGFGLSVLEGLYAGKPAIITKTGGLTRQVVNPYNGEMYGVALDPEVRSLVGSQSVPYIYEDFVSNQTKADAIWKMYKMGRDERERLGKLGSEYVRTEYSVDRLSKSWDNTLTRAITNWKNEYKPWEIREL